MLNTLSAKNRIGSASDALENFLFRWGAPLLAAFAFAYYAQYLRAGLNLGGEGGTNAVLALRLMEGQRPIADTFLGYNLLWFYPIVALFKITGPDYMALRVFFFVLSTINALLGFAIVLSTTRRAWLAMSTGILLVLIPGMLFRNYMGLIGVLSMLVLLKAYVLPARSERTRFRWMLAAGAGISVCFLLRIEPSLLIAIVWLGLAALYPLGSRGNFAPRLRTSVIGTLSALLVFATMHGAFLWHANSRGFAREFLGQYTSMIGYFGYELSQQWKAPAAASPPPAAVQAPVTSPTPASQSEWVQDRLMRPPLGDVWKARRQRDRYFGVMLYYPVFWSAVFVTAAAAMLGAAVFRGNEENKARALTILTTTGCALALFPQYFFFRPDAPHLSEFMVPFLVAMACSACAAWDAAQGASHAAWKKLVWLPVVFSVLAIPLYLKAIMPREEAGTWFRQGDTVEFQAMNGVRVRVSPENARALEGLQAAILSHASPDDYVICYPYQPTVNFMTARRSYEYNLYIDDATAGADFQRQAIERATTMKPAVFVIDNRPINSTEPSRFTNWASTFMHYLKNNYRLAGSFHYGSRELYVYVRPDKMP